MVRIYVPGYARWTFISYRPSAGTCAARDAARQGKMVKATEAVASGRPGTAPAVAYNDEPFNEQRCAEAEPVPPPRTTFLIPMRPGSTTPHHPNLLLTHSPTCSHGCRYQPRPTHSTHAPVERPTPRDLPSLRFSLRSPRDLLARPAAGLLPVSRPPHRPSPPAAGPHPGCAPRLRR